MYRWLSLIWIMLIFNGCTITPKYHYFGYQLSWKSSSLTAEKKVKHSKMVSTATSAFNCKDYKPSTNKKPIEYQVEIERSKLEILANKEITNASHKTSSISTITSARTNHYGFVLRDTGKTKKSLQFLEQQLQRTEQKVRNNFIGFAALLSPLIITGGKQDSKFVRGWNFTFLLLALIALVIALTYTFIYAFRWIRFTVARHTRKGGS